MSRSPQPVNSALPIGVVLPTYNSRNGLDAQLASMQDWLEAVEEIVVVDSHSTDGTLEYLKKNLSHPAIRFLSHPPGLYESWNHAMHQIQSRYTYIATMGDHITQEGLRGLAAVAEAERADAVISPPRFVDASGRPLDKTWPIHNYLKSHSSRCDNQVPPWQWLGWAVAFLPESLLGSSASNLYRTDYFHSNPFPLGYGHTCDTAWALANAFKARIAVAPRVSAVFRVHEALRTTSVEAHQQLMAKLVDLSIDVINSRLADDPDQQSINPQCRLMRTLLEDIQFKSRFRRSYKESRLPWCPWFLQPAARRMRSQRKVVKSRIDALREQLFTTLSVNQL